MKNTNFKRILSTVLFLVLVVATIFTITSCKHTHEFDEVVDKQPTCTEEGLITKTCTGRRCDHVETEAIPALGHDLIHHDGKDPSCTTEGFVAYDTCERCDYTTYEVIPAHGHDAVKIRWDNYVEPDCVNDGSYDVVTYCETCNTELERVKAFEDAYGHAWVTVEAKAPTCQAGYTEHEECKVCGATRNKVMLAPAYDHIKSECPAILVYDDATCTEKGSYTTAHVCNHCGYVYEETIEHFVITAYGHDLVEHEARTATCTQHGWDAYVTCNNCDYTTYSRISKLPHNNEHFDAKPVTCTEDGWGAYTVCKDCGYSTKDVEKAYGHSYNLSNYKYENVVLPTCYVEGEYDQVFYCDNGCGTALDSVHWNTGYAHDYEHFDALEPTCLDKGYTAYNRCYKCGKIEGKEEIPALGHSLVNHDAVAPTCTEIGCEAWEECDREGCDYSTYVELGALGHDIVALSAVAPTCTTSGLTEGQDCTRCDALDVVQVVIPKLGHNRDANGLCATCGDRISLGLTAQLVGDTYVITGIGSCTDKNIIIPSEINDIPVVSLSDDLFRGNTNIQSVVIPDSVKTIGKDAFFSCTSLKSVVIGNGVETIGEYAFFGCSRLDTVTVGSGVKTIGANAFGSCYRLSTVNYVGNAAAWNAIAIGANNSKLTGANRYYI